MKKESKSSISPLFLSVLAFFSVSPLALVLINSFKTHKDIVKNPLSVQFTAGFDNFIRAWQDASFGKTLVNSVIYSSSTVIVTLICASLAAYVLATRKIKIRSLVILYFMVTMTVPVQLFLVPLYRLYAGMGLLNSHVAVSLILAACNLPIAITLLRTFFLKVPKELEEAARIDGATTKDVLLKVILPVVSPGLITVAIIVGFNSWNEFLISSTFLQGEANFTAMLALMGLNGSNGANQGTNMAAAIILIAPVILFFIALQKRFIDGIISGSVKG